MFFFKCIVGVIFVFLLASCSPADQLPGKPWHHTTEGFRNPPGSPKRNDWIKRVSWYIEKPFQAIFGEKAKISKNHVLKRNKALEDIEKAFGKNTVTWLGHMTALLQIDGKVILTDPWFTSYATPLPPFGPKRYVAPALKLNDLPKVDFIVISHNHFDHLDLATITNIPNKKEITAIVPLGISEYFRDAGYERVVELDWEETITFRKIKFTALPAIHWSKRSAFYKNDTLWASWAIRGESGVSVFFGGDAEYGPIYADIGERHGDFDLSLLSVGAFLPRIVMRGAHCIPEECIKIGADMKARNHLAMGWGTVRLGDERNEDTVRRFKSGAKKLGIRDENVWIMKIGETRMIPTKW